MDNTNQDDPHPQAIQDAATGGGGGGDPHPQAIQNDDAAVAAAGGGGGETLKGLKKMQEKSEENFHRLLKQAFVLVNLYYFFEGVILTAVSQVSSPKCHQWYFFLVLSLIPLFLNGFPLLYLVFKCAEAKNETDRLKLLYERKRLNPGARINGQDQPPAGAHQDGYRKRIRFLGAAVAAAFLLVFTGVILFACRSMLCESNQSSTNINFDGDCFRVCNNQNKCLKICTE